MTIASTMRRKILSRGTNTVRLLAKYQMSLPASLSPFSIQHARISSAHRLASHLRSRQAFPSRSADNTSMKFVAVHPSPLPSPGNIRGVLFDVDGTLTDTDPLHLLAYREVLVEVGFNNGTPITDDFYRDHMSGRHNPDILAELFPLWTLEKRTVLLEDKERRFRKMAMKLEPVKGLPRLCAWIEKRGLRRCAVTNAPRANAEHMISALGLTSFFDHVIIGPECKRAKPFADPYLLGLQRLGIRADEAFAVEDSPAGMTAALAAGLPCIGVLTSQKESVMNKVGASICVKDYDDELLWELLE